VFDGVEVVLDERTHGESHHAQSGLFAADIDVAIIRITHKPVPTTLKLAIQLIQQQIIDPTETTLVVYLTCLLGRAGVRAGGVAAVGLQAAGTQAAAQEGQSDDATERTGNRAARSATATTAARFRGR